MKRYYLFFLSIAINLFSTITAENFEEDLPSGYVLETHPDAEDFVYFDELVKDENASKATLEGNPIALVAGCVNALTGDFIDSQVDVIVPGPTPLVVQRRWCSSDKAWHCGLR